MVKPENNVAYPWGRHVAGLLPLLVLLGCVLAGLGDCGSEEYFSWLRDSQYFLTECIEELCEIGNPFFYAIYVLIAWRSVKTRDTTSLKMVFGFIVGLAITLLTAEVFKFILGRPRPETGGDFLPFSFANSNQSFPSGHVAAAVMTIMPLIQFREGYARALLLGLWPACMALFRIYLLEHHPTDALGSVAVGSLGAYAAWHLLQSRTLRNAVALFLKWIRRRGVGSVRRVVEAREHSGTH